MFIRALLSSITFFAVLTIVGVIMTIYLGDAESLRLIFVDNIYPDNLTAIWCSLGLNFLLLEGCFIFPFIIFMIVIDSLYESKFFRLIVISLFAFQLWTNGTIF